MPKLTPVDMEAFMTLCGALVYTFEAEIEEAKNKITVTIRKIFFGQFLVY